MALPALMLGLQAVNMAAGGINAARQKKFEKAFASAKRRLAYENYGRQVAASQARRNQESAIASREIASLREQSLRAAGTAKAAAAEGFGGRTVEALINDVAVQELRAREAVILQESFRDEAFRFEGMALNEALKGDLLSALPGQVPQPDYIGGALAMLATYDKYYGGPKT